jgi:hypothetical protein
VGIAEINSIFSIDEPDWIHNRQSLQSFALFFHYYAGFAFSGFAFSTNKKSGWTAALPG